MHPVPTTLLAVDDSATMRKVLEMTFAGEEYRVVTANSVDGALAVLRAERPLVVLCDVTLDGVGGYGLCAKIKADNPAIAVVLLASKQQPYDSQKGGQARADDYLEKPFDTQALIDKVKRLMQRPATQEPIPLVRTAPASPQVQTAARPGGGTLPMGVAAGGRPPVPAGRAPAGPIGRGTLAYNPMGMQPSPEQGGRDTHPGPPPAPPPATHAPATARPAPHAPAASPMQSAASSPGSAVALAPSHGSPGAAAAAVASNGQLAAQLTNLGLTEAQITAVLALSREVIERVVWEVVPVLAETLIQEEIKRLTSPE
jgi:CheY-like chemotaxis protein